MPSPEQRQSMHGRQLREPNRWQEFMTEPPEIVPLSGARRQWRPNWEAAADTHVPYQQLSARRGPAPAPQRPNMPPHLVNHGAQVHPTGIIRCGQPHQQMAKGKPLEPKQSIAMGREACQSKLQQRMPWYSSRAMQGHTSHQYQAAMPLYQPQLHRDCSDNLANALTPDDEVAEWEVELHENGEAVYLGHGAYVSDAVAAELAGFASQSQVLAQQCYLQSETNTTALMVPDMHSFLWQELIDMLSSPWQTHPQSSFAAGCRPWRWWTAQ